MLSVLLVDRIFLLSGLEHFPKIPEINYFQHRKKFWNFGIFEEQIILRTCFDYLLSRLKILQDPKG